MRLTVVAAALVGLVCLHAEMPATRVGVTSTETRLTLAQAIEMALARNLEIEIEKSNVATAEQAVRGSRGFYDPRLRWQRPLPR